MMTWTKTAKWFCAILLCSLFSVVWAEETVVKPASTTTQTVNVQRQKLVKRIGEDDFRALCSGLNKCLDKVIPGCEEADLKPLPKVKYNEEYCAPYHEVTARGLQPDMSVPMAPEVFARLGRQYRAIYVNEGTLPLNEHVISYLFDNMPFTAQLINAYLETDYVLEYTSPNRRYFNGSNGRSLSGEFYWALQDSAGQKLGLRNLFFGYGHAKVLKWSLSGTAIAYLDMDPIPGNKLKYKLTAIVFPANSVLNSIMQMGLFKSVVNSKIDHIVDDIKKASGEYFGGNKEPMLRSAALKSQENIQNVLAFEEVVQGASWHLGDYMKRRQQQAEKKVQAPVLMQPETGNVDVINNK